MAAAQGTITKKMNDVLDDLQKEFKSMYTAEDFEAKMRAVENAGGRSDRASKLRKLFDMFDDCGVAYERGRDDAYYKELIRSVDFPDFLDIEARMLKALYSQYKKYPSPEEYMLRIVNRLSDKDDAWTGDTLRLRVLKQFIKYGRYLSDAGYGGKRTITNYVKARLGKAPTEAQVLALIDDGVFSFLDTATKAQKKPEGTYGLLKLADDLAGGKFRASGATKKGLYLFAMAYGMTYYSGNTRDGEILDRRTDLETNLFRDYYSNNLMRYISAAYQGKQCEFEANPSGQGINYKNFAEIIYLYFISQNIEPSKKIRLSSEMIRRVQKAEFKKGVPEPSQNQDTAYYRGLAFRDAQDNSLCEDILSLSAEDFEQFVCEHYDCDTYSGTHDTNNGPVDDSISEMQIEADQKTAYGIFTKILEKIEKLNIALNTCRYGLWFTDVEAFRKKELSGIERRLTGIDEEGFDDFIELLRWANSHIVLAFDKVSARNVTRTSVLVAYYYYYNALHEQDDHAQWKSFTELFNSFKNEADVYLKDAGYQELSAKNILDVLVVFSSYAYLNI